MKNSLLIFLFILLYACQEKQKAVVKGNPYAQEKISSCYNENIYNDPNTSATFCNNLEELEKLATAESNDFKAMVSVIAGLQNSNKSLYQLGIKNYEKALVLLQNSTTDSLKAKALNGIGNNYKIIGNYKKATKNLFAALKLYEKDKNVLGIGSVHTILGDLYFQMDKLEKAKQSYELAMQVLKHHKSSMFFLSTTHSLANYYGMNGNFDKALSLDEMGLRICDSLSIDKMKVSFLDNKANCFLFSNRMDSAYYYFNECLKLDIKIGNKKQIADTYSNLSQFFLMKKDYKTAEKHAKTSIVLLKTIDGKPNLAKSYDILSEIYTSQNQYQKAFEVQKERMANYKLMLQDREASASAEYKIVYETQKKEAKIKVLELENKVRNLKIEQQELQMKRSNYMLILFGLLFSFVLALSYFWLKHQKIKSQLERQQAIKETEEAERIRMAKDIHDDLGSDLTKINFLSELISQQSKELPVIHHSTESIKETAKKMIDNMRDLIWALNPENATLANLIARMREHTTDYLEDYPITLDYTISDNLPKLTVANEVHRALFLVVKEAIHNIAKHSKANHINFTITLTDFELKCSIQDNGIGFISSNTKGNGLINMKSRIQEIGGTLSVNTKQDEGTEVVFEIKLKSIFKK